MRVHHDKHHQAYVDKVNAALEGTDWADRPMEEVIANLAEVPEDKYQNRRPDYLDGWRNTVNRVTVAARFDAVSG
jgi:superoxide dismutase